MPGSPEKTQGWDGRERGSGGQGWGGEFPPGYHAGILANVGTMKFQVLCLAFIRT